VDVFAQERRRIERDLHDGAQQHLVLLSLHLGEAEYALDQGRTAEAKQALAAAQASVEAAMTALRETVRGIHPQILSDRGLSAAVHELASRQPVAVDVLVSGDSEPGEAVSLAAYYLVSEAFTNAAKHSRASRCRVELRLSDPLELEVFDDGVGGARIVPGHGLSGLMERAQAVGGQCWLSSPIGGPTHLRAVFPNPALAAPADLR
jgi:signal transduction histidine kinase